MIPTTLRRVALLVLAVAILLVVPPASAQERGSPNIVLVMVDDLGYGDLSSYGATDLQTPHVDSLVALGMRFDRFYANSPVCSPTRASLLTGRYPDLAGVPGVIRTHARNSWGYLSEEEILLPRVLARAGYHTGMVGKWHLGLEPPNTPNERGFAFCKGYLGDMMDDYYSHRRHGINYMRRNDRVIDPEGHATDLFTEWAVEYVEKRARSEAPFFLYLAYNAPHSPIQPPDAWLRKVRARESGIGDERARIVALIEHLDHGIGEVVEALRRSGVYENTLIVFVSDNGGAPYFGADNGDLRGGKQDMYEGGIRVPAVAVWPDHIESGSRTGRIGLTMDLYPTLAEAAGVSLSHRIDGRSLLPVLTDRLGEEGTAATGPAGGLPGERTLFWVRREGGSAYVGQTAYAARRGRWKIVQNRPREPFHLYDLEADPREREDLREEHPDRFGELAEALRRHIQEAGTVPWQPPHAD